METLHLRISPVHRTYPT